MNEKLHVETDFVKWYLENFEYLPIKFTNTICAFNNFFYNHDGKTIFNYTADDFTALSMSELYQKNKDLYNLYFNKEFRHIVNMKDFINELYIESNSTISKLEIAEFVFSVAYVYIKEISVTDEFFSAQHNYRKSLTQQQYTFLRWYTYKGDVILNTFIRDKNNLDIDKTFTSIEQFLIYLEPLDDDIDLTIEENKKNFVFKSLKYIVSIINKTILKAPRNKLPFLVYQYSDKPLMIRDDNYWENLGFYSTTLTTTYFIKIQSHYNNYKTHIIIPKNTPCLLLNEISVFPSEHEVLFSSKNCFKVLKPYTEYFLEETKPYYKRLMIYEKKGTCNN